jgi:hypothetical protein
MKTVQGVNLAYSLSASIVMFRINPHPKFIQAMDVMLSLVRCEILAVAVA